MAAVDNREISSDLYEHPEPASACASVLAQSIDLSCIHWGYLNCALVQDPTKKVKELSWKTYWVDLCGSTLRLYRDLLLGPDSAAYPPPSKVIGPTSENEKKEAFVVLKKGASISMWDNNKVKSKKKSKKSESPKYNVFKLQVVNINNSPVYLFEAPSKGSMYRWISKIEEGIDMADNPQNHSTSDHKLQEAKRLAMESRRYQTVAPELKYSDVKDDTDSGMEGDEESFEVPEKPPSDPKLENLRKTLQIKRDLLKILEEGEKAFIGDGRISDQLNDVSEFQATTKMDYYLIPGYASTLIPKDTQINILGQLPNKRWRCYVDLPKTSTQTTPEVSTESDISSLGDSRCSTPSCENTGSSVSFDNYVQSTDETERLIGSVPTSLLVELNHRLSIPAVEGNLTVLGTPDVTPSPSPLPSPPHSPYSTHKYKETSNGNNDDNFQRRSPTNLQRFVPSMDLSDVDAWEQFIFPSPPSTPVTSRSTTPSLSPCVSLDNVDSVEGENNESMSDDVPVTVIDQEGCSPLNSARGSAVPHSAVMRLKDEAAMESQKNYSFLVTKKLRQRGISLIVGSSSSEDEDEDEEKGENKYAKLTRRKLDEELERFAADDSTQATVRPYSAFVPRKSSSISFGASSKTASLRTTTTDKLLRDYSSSNLIRSKTCVTIKSLGGFRTRENAPPLNQRRTILLERSENGGFGFTLQTYGIVQQGGDVEYMTFVLSVEEDGPAYMAGMRPGDIIIIIENQDTEEADHKTIVELLQKAPPTVRMVVVFVDAIRRMHLNTKLKVIRSELEEREDEFRKLSQKEQQLLTHKSTLSNIDILGPTGSRQNSYRYTTELTSSFSKDSPKVKDSFIQYKQPLDGKPRRKSLPDQAELKKQHLISTTGNELLKNFASSAESMLKKSASVKLKKKVMKAKKTSKTFKSYVDLDGVKGDDFQGEAPLRSSSPLGTKNTTDTEHTRLSWPTTSHSLPSSTAQNDKSKSLSKDFVSSQGNGETPRGFSSSPSSGPRLVENSLIGNQSEKSPMKETSTPMLNHHGNPSVLSTSGSNAEPLSTPFCAVHSPKMSTEDRMTNDRHAVSASCDRDDTKLNTGVNTPPGSVSANAKTNYENNDVQSFSTSDGRGGLENNKVGKTDKKVTEIKSGLNSPMGSTAGDSVKQTSNGKLIDKYSSNEKECPYKSTEKDSNRSKLSFQTRVSPSASPKLLHKSPVTKVNSPYSLMSGSSNKDRPHSNNIASLRRIFEGEKSMTSSHSPVIVEDEERDEFPVDISKDVASFPESVKPRLGSRPMSFMCAMDAAEESPLIPDDNEANEDKMMYETSA